MKRGIGVGGLLVSLLFLSVVRAEVRDNAGFFSADAVQRANDATQQMRRDLGKELLVETYPAISADRAQNYRPENKDQFFQKWGNERAESAHVDGVYILIDKDPAYLFVTAGNKTQQRDFTQQDERDLRSQMLPLMKQKQFDDALNKAVEFVPARIRENRQRPGNAAGTANPGTYQAPPLPGGQSPGNYPTHGPTAPFPNGSPIHLSGLVCFGIFLIAGFFILRRLFGRRSNTGGAGYSGYGGYPPGYGGGSGGFGRGILGGMLGGLAGGWLGNRLGRRNDPGYGAPPPPDAGIGGGFNDSGGDTGFSGGAGGSFGDSGGGGGGDSGGSSDSGAGGSF